MAQHRQDEKANAMYALYQEGYSLGKVAAAFGVTRQSVYKMFAKRDFVLRERLEPLPYVVFNGEKYTLRKNGYYGKTSGSRSYLHRDIWEHHHGPIPDGYDVHHKDENKAHNRIGNFELLEKAEHARLHGRGQGGVVGYGRGKAKVT